MLVLPQSCQPWAVCYLKGGRGVGWRLKLVPVVVGTKQGVLHYTAHANTCLFSAVKL